jgi:hypothetical protein
MNDIFREATKRKLRFQFRGDISVEEVWRLKPEEINSIYNSLMAKKKEIGETKNLFGVKNPEADDLTIKIAIIEDIAATMVAEANQTQTELANKQRKQEIMEELDKRRKQNVTETSTEDLQKELAGL